MPFAFPKNPKRMHDHLFQEGNRTARQAGAQQYPNRGTDGESPCGPKLAGK